MKNVLSPSEKIDVIADNIEKRLGETAARRFRGAVVLYSAQGVEPFTNELFYRDYWANTKRIIDKANCKRSSASDHNQFLLFIRNLEQLEHEIEEKKAKAMAEEGNIEFSEAMALLEEYGDVFSIEGYREEVIKDNSWSSYEEFVECALLVLECDSCDFPEWNPVYELWWHVNAAREVAEGHGNNFTYEEMLDIWIKLKAAQEKRDWELWSSILHYIYGERSESRSNDG